MAVLDHGRRVVRSARVAYAGARIYLGYKRVQRRVRNWPADRRTAAWTHEHDVAAARLYRLAVDLKGLLIKTGQFVGTRSDVFPDAYVRELSKLQDRVPPRPARLVRATIEEELGAPVETLFARFDNRPIAAASLAQVHRARLPDGRDVAVKVQYPEVAALVRLDLRNLRFMVGEVAKREPSFDYRAIVEELARQIPLELDFMREAEMMRRVRDNLRELPGIVIPRPVEGLVSRRVLVSEFLEGQRLLDGATGLPAGEGERLARLVAGAFGHQVMIDGLFQADPHPGNLLLLPGGRVGLLDFGLTKELPPAVRYGFARLVVAAGDRDVPRILDAFRELGLRTKSDAPEAVLPLIELFFDPRDLTPDRGTRFRERQTSALGRNPVEALPGDLILLGRVVGLLRGVSASLGTPLRPMEMLRPYAEQLLEGGQGNARK